MLESIKESLLEVEEAICEFLHILRFIKESLLEIEEAQLRISVHTWVYKGELVKGRRG